MDQSLTNHGLKANNSEHLQEKEESESEANEESQSESRSETTFTTSGPEITSEQHARVQQLLDDLQEGRKPHDDSEQTQMDQTLDRMNYQDFPALRRAKAALTVKAKDKKLDVVFRSRITAMVGTLNLYLDPELSYTWREASLVVAKSQGSGIYRARRIRTWIHKYLHTGNLPMHFYGRYHSSILEDEDFAQGIQLQLVEIAKDGYIKAEDIVDYVATPEIQEKLGSKARGISIRTAQRWL